MILCGVVCLAATLAISQYQGGRSNNRSNRSRHEVLWRPRRMPSRSEFPTWDIQYEFKDDVFTFIRIQYDSFGPFGWWDRWDNDYPDGDWNFSYQIGRAHV